MPRIVTLIHTNGRQEVIDRQADPNETVSALAAGIALHQPYGTFIKVHDTWRKLSWTFKVVHTSAGKGVAQHREPPPAVSGWWVGFLQGEKGLVADPFKPEASFQPNADGGWGSYVKVQGPYSSWTAAKAAKAGGIVNPKKKNPRPRIKNHSHGDIKHLLSLVGRDVKQAHAIYRKGDAKQAASMLQMLMFRSGALNTVALDSTVSSGSDDWMRVQGAVSAVDKALDWMRETAGVERLGGHWKKAGRGVRGFGLASGKIKRAANPSTAYRWFTPELEARAKAIPQRHGTRYSPFTLKAEDTRFRAGYFDGSKGEAPAPNRTEAYVLGYVAGRLDIGRLPLSLLSRYDRGVLNPKKKNPFEATTFNNLPAKAKFYLAGSARVEGYPPTGPYTKINTYTYKDKYGYVQTMASNATEVFGSLVQAKKAYNASRDRFGKPRIKNLPSSGIAFSPAAASAAAAPMRLNPEGFLDSGLSVSAYLKKVKVQQKRDLAKVKLVYVHDQVGGTDRWVAPFKSGQVVIYAARPGGDYQVYWNHSHYSSAKLLPAAKQLGREAAGYFNGISSNAMGATKRAT